MKLINNYNDYIIDTILESIKNDEFSLILSDKLIQILVNIDHDISYKLLGSQSNTNEKFKITLLDIDDDNNDINNFDKIIFMQSNKVYDDLNKHIKSIVGGDDISLDDANSFIIRRRSDIFKILNKNKVTSTIGRVINKLYPNEFPNAGKINSIESFIDKFKAERTKNMSIFKLVEGDDIIKYYNSDNYDSDSLDGTSLGSSCMRYNKCSNYIKFYSINNLKMLILMSNDEQDKIIGRALVWPNVIINGDTNRIFMDRIYTTYSSDVYKFKEYANKKGWLYKSNQNRDPNEYIFDPLINDTKKLNLEVHNIIESNSYPYLDTIKFLDLKNNILTNNYSKEFYNLESTKGGYYYKEKSYVYNLSKDEIELEFDEEEISIDDDEQDTLWSEIEQSTIDAEDAYYSDYLQTWASPQYADNHWVYSEIMDDYIPIGDIVEIGNEYVTHEYAQNHFKYSDMDEKWYYNNQVVWSEKQGWLNNNNVVKVYLDLNKHKFDWRYDNNDYITYINEDGNDEYYDEDILGEHFVRVYSDMNGRMIELKKEEDKDKYFYYKGNLYLNNLKNEII